MSTNRVLYTVADIKEVLAKLEGVPPDSVQVFECQTLSIGSDFHGMDLMDEHYVFQVDK